MEAGTYEEKDQPPSDSTQPSERDQKERATDKAPYNGWHPEEEKHRRWEKWYWALNFMLSVFVAVGAISSGVFAYWAVSVCPTTMHVISVLYRTVTRAFG